jgi:hypothetical protein
MDLHTWSSAASCAEKKGAGECKIKLEDIFTLMPVPAGKHRAAGSSTPPRSSKPATPSQIQPRLRNTPYPSSRISDAPRTGAAAGGGTSGNHQ